MSFFDELLDALFGDNEPEPEFSFECDITECAVHPPIEAVLAIITNKILDADYSDVQSIVVYVLRDPKIPMASAPAAVAATAAELKKQHPWLAHVKAPQELEEARGPRQRAILYRWLADIYELHGTSLEVRHTEDPDWVRGQTPTEVVEQLHRDGYDHLGEDLV